MTAQRNILEAILSKDSANYEIVLNDLIPKQDNCIQYNDGNRKVFLFTTPIYTSSNLEEIYGDNSKFSELIADQFKNKYIGPCIKCDDFSPASDYHFHIPWTKIYKIFYK